MDTTSTKDVSCQTSFNCQQAETSKVAINQIITNLNNLHKKVNELKILFKITLLIITMYYLFKR